MNSDWIIYLLDAVILSMEIRMLLVCRKIEIKAEQKYRWVIPAVFWALATASALMYKGTIRYIQPVIVFVLGLLYWLMGSGLSRDGLVVIGKLYPYKKISRYEFDENRKQVQFYVKTGAIPLDFPDREIRELRKYLSANAGIPLKNVR